MQIIGFRSEPAGLFLDVEQLPGVVSLSRETGEVTLPKSSDASATDGDSASETIGADKVNEVEVVSTDDGRVELKLSLKGDESPSRSISLGTSDQAQAARSWADEFKTIVSLRARRARLNPTFIPGQGRPASAITPNAPSDGINPVSQPVAVAAAPAVSPPAPASAPVELAAVDAAIDASLEQELDAAMQGQMTAPTNPPPGAVVATSAVTTLPTSEDQLESGMKLKAKVQSLTAEDVFCEVGFRCPGVLPLRQFPQGKHPHVGEEFLVVVEKYDPENGVILVNLPRATRKVKGNWDELAVGQVVECMVTKTNKGGLEVTIGGTRAFLPASQVDLGFAPAMESFVGKKLAVQVTEVNPAKRNLVVSRRAILIQEKKEKAAAFWPSVEVGQQFTGTVKTIKDYGAFVDLGGADGFLHIGEMSWSRIKHPTEVVQEGGQVEVVVLSLDREKQKIGLGMRQLARNPWASVAETYGIGNTVTGKVTRLSEFGAFVELEPSVEGLIHISELDHQRVRRVQDVVNVGQEVQVKILEVALDRQRISLSLKALKQKPEPEKPAEPETPPPPPRKRKENLRGGKSDVPSGGLFGNPNDYR